MEDKYERWTDGAQTEHRRTEQNLDIIMNFGHLFHLFLVLGAELAAGRTLLTSPEVALDSDTQSIISDLEEALTKFRSRINATHLGHLPILGCNETAADLQQVSMVTSRLSHYQACAQKLQLYSSDEFCRAVLLNNDLLTHLGWSETSPCPASPSSCDEDFHVLRKYIRCVDCWSQQVAALHK